MIVPDYWPRLKAIDEIAKRTKEKYDQSRRTPRTWKNIIAGQIATRIKNGAIKTMQEDRVCNASVAASMREKYPDIFDDWPIQTVIIEINCVMPGFVGEMTAHVMPQALEECHRVINGLFADLINARDIQQTLMQEIELLRPDAERYRAIKKTNQKNATKSKKVSMI